jgi:hypothetical protein
MFLEAFLAHLTTKTEQAIAEYGCHLKTNPGGFTRKVQVMDVGAYESFKGYFCNDLETWSQNVILVYGKNPVAQQYDSAVLVRMLSTLRSPGGKLVFLYLLL